MSETISAPGSLGGYPDPARERRLHGNLGVSAIVFMVVAAAAPLGVVGGVFPLGIASGNGAGFPATFIVSTVILLLFAVGFTALTPYVGRRGRSSRTSGNPLASQRASASASSPW